VLAEKYRLDALVGVGGMGAVYSAQHLGINRHVAVKILQPNIALGNEQIMSLFEREAKMAGHLMHENIANVIDAGRTPDGISYIAMEWLEGRTLEDELAARGPFSFSEAGEILSQVASALDTAHDHHIIHRDLKPSNIMLVKRAAPDAPPCVKVLDFGIAKVVSETTAASVSAPMGTPHYASPEQFRTGGHIDARSDVYSLGVVLYRLLTGIVPFQTNSVHELIQRQLTEPPEPLRRLRPDTPPEVEDLVARMLAKDPNERPQRAGEAADEFYRAISFQDEPTRADRPRYSSGPSRTTGRQVTPWHTKTIPVSTGQVRAGQTAPTLRKLSGYLHRAPRRSAALAVLLLALAAGAFYYWRSPGGLDEAQRRLVIVSFENLTADADLDGLERIAPELLRQRLSILSGIEVTPGERFLTALKEIGRRLTDRLDRATAIEAARRAGAGALITGAVNRVGGRLTLNAEVTDVAGDARILTAKAEGSRPEDVFAMVEQLSSAIASHYGIASSLQSADPPTRSYEALRYFQAGGDALLARDGESAVTNYDKASKIDPQFAIAFLGLGRACLQSEKKAAAKDAFTRAWEMRERADEHDRMLIEGYYQWVSRNDRTAAARQFEAVVTRYPKDREALLSLAILYRDLKQYDRSIECGRRATAIDPGFGAAWNTIGYSYLLKRDFVNAIDAFKRYAEAETDNPNPQDSLGDTYAEAGLYDEAIAAYQRSFELKPDFFDYLALWKKGEVYFVEGDHARAAATAEQFLRNTAEQKRRLGHQTLARIELYGGRLSAARARFAAARATTRGERANEADTILREAILLAALRRDDEALKLIGEARALQPQSRIWIRPLVIAHALAGRFDEAWREFGAQQIATPNPIDFELRARDAQARGDYASAIGLWKNLREQLPAVPRYYDLSLAYLGAGQAAEAERELREGVRARPVPDLGSGSPINPLYDVNFILAHYELARASETLGKREQAAEYYRRFLAFWGGADFKLPEIEQARARLSALGQ
jgi:serine/threonine protein kinase/Tfp pilus assembly protein PilF